MSSHYIRLSQSSCTRHVMASLSVEMFSAGVLLLCDVSLIQCSGRILTISTEQRACRATASDMLPITSSYALSACKSPR